MHPWAVGLKVNRAQEIAHESTIYIFRVIMRGHIILSILMTTLHSCRVCFNTINSDTREIGQLVEI